MPAWFARGALLTAAACGIGGRDVARGQTPGGECDAPKPGWIFCDDFEQNRLRRYFEYDSAGGSFTRVAGVGVDGSWGMRARWGRAGQVSAGALHLAFGRTPSPAMRPVDGGRTDHREIYWRVFVRNQPGWTGGGGDKLSRAQILATPRWAQAMVAPVWSGGRGRSDRLVVDPASGTDPTGALRTTAYNDFPNLRWLGAAAGRFPLFDDRNVGQWYCVEARVKLNDPGRANGEFQLWIEGQLDAGRANLNWVGTFAEYGLNTVFLENYWNGGAPRPLERYVDRFIVSTAPIGCD